MQIDGRQIGEAVRPYVIAELSANHDQDRNRALDLIEAAAEAGADAVKFQLYDPERLAEARGGVNKMLTEGPWLGWTLGRLYRRAYTPWDWISMMSEHATAKGITWFSSAFDLEGVRFLKELDCPAYKISSFDAGNRVLIASAMSTGKPVIVSGGLASEDDLQHVVRFATGPGKIALLHCVSEYPCPTGKAALGNISLMRMAYGVPVGFSDHTIGQSAAIGAVALGACIVEKHIKLRPDDNGVDAAFSMTPSEFAVMRRDLDTIWQATREVTRSMAYQGLKVVT